MASETSWRFEYSKLEGGRLGAGRRARKARSRKRKRRLKLARVFRIAVIGELWEVWSPGMSYYVRLFAKNAGGEGEVCQVASIGGSEVDCEPIVTAKSGFVGFRLRVCRRGDVCCSWFARRGDAYPGCGRIPTVVPTSAEQKITVEGLPRVVRSRCRLGARRRSRSRS